MNDMIKFYYNLEAENLTEKEEIFYWETNKMQFMLCPFVRSKEELNDIYQICIELKKLNVPVHTFIQNRNNEIITQIYEKEYILLKIEEKLEKEYNVLDIIKMSKLLHLTEAKSELYRNQWSELWSNKIDYFEYQIYELGKDKKVILNSFTYYIGLAENAIAYVNNTTEKYTATELDKITLCHKRVAFPNFAKTYLNPLLFIFDLEVRDVAEYVKSAFFENQKDAWIELKTYLNTKKLSIYGYQLLFARLLYPSYYFDVYEQVMNKEKNEEELIKFVKQSKDYELFLAKTYIEITKKVPIEKINWITDKIKI